jgi:hypothetical protein
MACGSCVQKLALTLIDHHRHKLDFIRALELAEKGVERHEKNKPEPQSLKFEGVRTVTEEQMQKLSFDPDYSTACTPTGYCACYSSTKICTYPVDCLSIIECDYSCPSPPKAHSHFVSETCISDMSYTCNCGGDKKCLAGKTCTCICTGLCYYSCDTGYAWNPVTELCEAIAGVAPHILGDGLTWIIT